MWRYRFEPDGGRTRVTESYQVRWIPLWARILDVPLNRHKELVANMGTTLERLKLAAESDDGGGTGPRHAGTEEVEEVES